MKEKETICLNRYIKIVEAVLNGECVDDYNQEILFNFQEYINEKLKSLNEQFQSSKKLDYMAGMIQHPDDWYKD